MKNNVAKRILSILIVVLMMASIFPEYVMKAEAAVQTEITKYTPYTITLLEVSSEKFTEASERLEMFQVRVFDTEKGEIFAVVKFRGTSGYQDYWPSGVISGTFQIRDCAQPYEEELVLTYTLTSTSDPYFVSFRPFDVDFTIKITRPATEHTGDATCTTEGVCTVCGETYKAPCNYQWKQENGQHWQECTLDSTHAKVNAGSCSGGKATCTKKATCETCNFKYGKALGHDWSKLDGICARENCGTICTHSYIDGKCEHCEYECPHENQTGESCEVCGKSLHTHSFEYTAGLNGRIVATCVAADCALENGNGGTFTIFAPADLYADGTTAKEVVIDNQLVESVDYTVTYSTEDGNAPKTAGTYTASVTIGDATASVEYTLVKRNAAADMFVYTASESLVYDGTAKYATVEVSPEITGMGDITVTYYKDGVAVEPVDAGTYTVKASTAESDKYYALTDIELGSFTIDAKDISDGLIILGDALTYNGEEQTQTVEKVLATGTAPEATFDVSGNKATNVGVYLLTVTGTGNFTGKAKLTFEIAVDMNGVDFEKLHALNVKSSDKESIEYIYNQVDNASGGYADAEKKAEWNLIKNDCNELLLMINSVTSHLENLKEEVAEYDIDTVTSADYDYLEDLYESEAQWLYDFTENYTDEEINEFSDALDDISALQKRISDVRKEFDRVIEEVEKYSLETVTSDNKADIEQLVADINVLTDGQNITTDERARLELYGTACDRFLTVIAETKSEYERLLEAANSYDEATVTSDDVADLEKLNDDIYALALTDNLTAEEKANLQAAHDKVIALLDKLVGISDEIKRIIEKVDAYVFESVKSSDKADIEQLIADIKALLDTQNLTADERTLLETADETCDKLIAKIDETVAEINRINEATNAYNIDTVTSADKADIERLIADIKALTDGDNLTESERAQLVQNDEALDALLAKINATAGEIARIDEAVNGYDEETVKSTDKADLEQLKADIKALTDKTNITEDERTKLGELDATLDSLIKKIDDTAAEIARIDEAVNGYDAEAVTSADVPALGKLIDDIEALTGGQNITEDERAALEANDEAIDALVEMLTEVAEEIKRVDEETKSYDIDNVKSTDTEALAQLKDDVQALIDSGNTTENEKTALQEMVDKVEAFENRIEEIETQLEGIGDFEEGFNSETVTSDSKQAIEEAIAEIEAVNPDNLTDEQKAEYDEIKAELETLLEEIEKAGAEVEALGAELEMFDEERVTIFHKDEIEALKAKADELLADDNMGEAEKAKLEEYKAQCDNLIEIINTPAEYFSMRLFYFVWDALNWLSSHVVFIFNWIAAMF